MERRSEFSTLLDCSSKVLSDLKNLVTEGSSIDVTDANGKTALLIALEKKEIVAVKKLLKAGADVNKTNNSGQTPLMIAVDKGHTEYVRVLLDAGANINNVDSNGMSALMITAQNGNVDCLHMLITAGADLNVCDIQGKTALAFAVEENKCDCLKCLIEAGADIHNDNSKGYTPVKLAVNQNCESCLQILIQAGADLDQIDTNGQTALMIAAYEGYVECVECLVQGGARQELLDTKGRTALMLAASKGNYKCLQILQAGESWRDLQCQDGKTALIYAAKLLYESCQFLTFADSLMFGDDLTGNLRNMTDIAQVDRTSNCLQILLKAGANATICDRDGMSPLMYAAQVDREGKFFQNLVDAGSDINMTDKFGYTALLYAAENGNCEYVNMLADAGASVNIASQLKEPPLIYLIKRLVLFRIPATPILCRTVNNLLNHGADVNAQDYDGMTPLIWAAKSKHSEGINIMSSLIKHGAKIDMTDNRGSSALYHTFDFNDNIKDNTRFLLDQGANPNIITADGRSGISVAIEHLSPALLAFILKYNENPKITWMDFCHILGNRKMLQLMVLNSAMPPEAFQIQSKNNYRRSFLKQTLDSGRLESAKFLLASGYLNQFDITNRDYKIVKYQVSGCFAQKIKVIPQPHFTSFLENVHSQPWPLVKLCFVAVSSLVGGGPERKERVRMLGLPERIQRMLLFQDPIAKLCVKNWESIPFCFDPVDYEKLPNPRPLLFYWPFGHDLTPCDCSECSATGFKFV